MVKGRLLLAMPRTNEDEFYRSVILMLAHGPQGALGVVLNRPTERGRSVSCFPNCPRSRATGRAVRGGPVEPDGIICLARGAVARSRRPGFAPVLDRWGSIDPREPPPGGVDSVRVYRGYAGWSPRQLEGELARDAWMIVEAGPQDLSTDEPDTLWGKVLDRQGPRYSQLKHIPRNPSLN